MLVLSVNASENSTWDTLNIYDKTGIFNTSPLYYNSGGWQDISTAFIADTNSVTINITVPDASTLLPTGTTYTFSASSLTDPYPTLPNVAQTPFAIASTDLGMGDELTEGEYYITYTVNVDVQGTPTNFTASKYVILYGQTCCCVEELVAAADVSCGCEDNESVANALYARGILRGMQRAIQCNKNAKALEDLKELQKICSRNANCKNC